MKKFQLHNPKADFSYELWNRMFPQTVLCCWGLLANCRNKCEIVIWLKQCATTAFIHINDFQQLTVWMAHFLLQDVLALQKQWNYQLAFLLTCGLFFFYILPMCRALSFVSRCIISAMIPLLLSMLYFFFFSGGRAKETNLLLLYLQYKKLSNSLWHK